jgi:hypothetical protein
MIKRILIVVGVIVVIGLILLWIIQGGITSAIHAAENFRNPLSFGGDTGSISTLQLPWQPADMTRGPDISGYVAQSEQQASDLGGAATPQSGPVMPIPSGTPSPYVGKVHLSLGAPTESDPSLEYLQLSAGYSQSAPIVVSGWSLQSALSGARVYIPEAAPDFVMGIVNNVVPVMLSSGETAYITTGASPVGVSFEENMCMGYLRELRTFTPDISSECPSPKDALPENAQTLQQYGSSCFDYVGSLSQCHFPGTALPSDLSPTCQSFIVNTYSYNGCVNSYRYNADFHLPAWHLYLNHATQLWGNTHEVIRLLDAQGHVVDSLSY